MSWLEALHKTCMRHARLSTEEVYCGDGSTITVCLAKRTGALRKVACWTSLVDDSNAIVQFAPSDRVLDDLSTAMSLSIVSRYFVYEFVQADHPLGSTRIGRGSFLYCSLYSPSIH